MNLVYKMQPTRQQILGGGASDPTSDINVNAMCANGLLRIQDILRPRDAMMAAAAAAGHQAAAESLGLHQHPGLHPHHLSQLHHGLTSFGGLNVKASSISPPIGPDQSPPATPPMMLHSPDSLKGSPDHHHHHNHHHSMQSGNSTKGGRDKDDLNSSKKFSDKGKPTFLKLF